MNYISLQITEEIETLQVKLQLYRIEIAKDSAQAVTCVSDFEASIHTPAMVQNLLWTYSLGCSFSSMWIKCSSTLVHVTMLIVIFPKISLAVCTIVHFYRIFK